MKAEEARRVVEAMTYVADDYITRAPSGTHDGKVAAMGMTLLRDHLRSVLDFQALVTEEAGVDALALADLFCRGHCPCSRVALPGEHALCVGCPLRAVTVDLEQRRVDDAMQKETADA